MSLAALKRKLKIKFRDRSWLEQALVHSSYINENPDSPLPSNERLEFLGDAVLGLIVAQWLFDKAPPFSEGEMTRIKAVLVQRETLAEVGAELGLGCYLKLGKGEETSGGRQRPANLGNALEAVIGAIYMDSGLEAARDFVVRILGDRLEEASAAKDIGDYKSRLQELAQERFGISPGYQVIEETGPPHRPRFRVQALIGERAWGVGEGASKKAAEARAARQALEALAHSPESA